MDGEVPLENLMRDVALKNRAAFAQLYNRACHAFGVYVRRRTALH